MKREYLFWKGSNIRKDPEGCSRELNEE